MNQLAIDFEPVRARKRDPETSQRSAGNARQFAAGHFALILDALERGPGTAKEISQRCGLDYVAVNRRIGELGRMSPPRAVTTGEVRDGCREWRLA